MPKVNKIKNSQNIGQLSFSALLTAAPNKQKSITPVIIVPIILFHIIFHQAALFLTLHRELFV